MYGSQSNAFLGLPLVLWLIIVLWAPYVGICLLAFVAAMGDADQLFLDGAFRLLIPATMGAALVGGLLAMKLGQRIRISAVDIAVALFGLTCVVVTVLNEGPEPAGGDVPRLISFTGIIALFFIARLSLVNERHTRKVFLSAIIGGSIVSLLAVAAYFFGGSLSDILVGGRRGAEVQRLVGFSQNPNNFASLFTVLLPLSISCAIESKRVSGRYLWPVIIGILVSGLLLTFSRSGWLGAAVGSSVTLSLYRNWNLRSVLVLVLCLGLSILAVGVITEPLGLKTALSERLSREALHQKGGDRLPLFEATCRMIVAHPLGVGLGNFRGRVEEFGGPPGKAPHNAPLAVAAEGGVLALMWLLLAWILAARHLLRAARWSSRSGSVLAAGAFGAGIGFGVHSLFHNYLHWGLYWVLFGAAVTHALILTTSVQGELDAGNRFRP